MVEPARADRDVHFGRPPHNALWIAMLERLGDARTIRAGVGHDIRVDGRPVRVARLAPFVAAPPDIRSRIGEHYRVRLQSPHERKSARPIINLALPVRALTVRAIEPDFRDGSVSCQQLRELGGIDLVVPGTVAVRRMVPIPWREIQPGTQVERSAGIHELPDDVTTATAKGTAGHRVLRRRCWPEAESIVMLGR